MKLRIKYCGGCNPIIDRKKLVDEVINILKDAVDVELVNENADVGLVVGGCSVSCVNLSEIEDQAKNWVIVGGNLVDHYQVSPDKQSAIVAKKILLSIN